MLRQLKNLDWILIASSFLLVGFGLLSIYSSSVGKGDFLNFKKQILFFAIGILLMFFFCFFDWKTFRENSYFILTLYFICLAALVGVLFFAPLIRGVRSWYKIGMFSIDPIELTKIVLIILLAKYFSKRHVEMYQVRHILLSGFYIFLPALLVFLQPNMGSVLILVSLWVGILIVSGIKIRHFLFLLFCSFLILILGWNFLLKDYQKERVMSFISPQIEPLGINWNQNQAKIAIGSGKIFGQGIGAGSQTQYGFLPESQTDFIFASIAEETGLFGVSVLLLLFLILIWRIFKIALSSQSNFSRLFSTGIATLIISQTFINIGMNLGILPIIGIPLPLVSYGGNGLITLLMGIGILENIRNNP
jgi:rod shape determining protein RodA